MVIRIALCLHKKWWGKKGETMSLAQLGDLCSHSYESIFFYYRVLSSKGSSFARVKRKQHTMITAGEKNSNFRLEKRKRKKKREHKTLLKVILISIDPDWSGSINMHWIKLPIHTLIERLTSPSFPSALYSDLTDQGESSSGELEPRFPDFP